MNHVFPYYELKIIKKRNYCQKEMVSKSDNKVPGQRLAISWARNYPEKQLLSKRNVFDVVLETYAPEMIPQTLVSQKVTKKSLTHT